MAREQARREREAFELVFGSDSSDSEEVRQTPVTGATNSGNAENEIDGNNGADESESTYGDPDTLSYIS